MTTPIGQFVDSTIGRTSTNPFITMIMSRAPTGNDGINNGLQVGQRWIDTSDGNREWFLLGFIAANGYVQANWVFLSSGLSTTETLTGNSGGVVNPDAAQNINVVGDGTTGLLFAGFGSTLTGTLNAIPNSALANNSMSFVAGTGISISTSPVSLGGTTTISALGSGLAWVNVASNTQAMVRNTGYVMGNGGSLVTLTLPATAVIGDTYVIQGQSSGGWKVDVNTGQILNVGNQPTTVTTGSASSTNQWNSITIVCTTANTTFAANTWVGNLTVE